MNTDYSSMSIDELVAAARPQGAANPDHTIVMPGRFLKPQDLQPQDEPQAIPAPETQAGPPGPPPPKVKGENRKGRARFEDPTNPEQIQGIAQRCVRHYILTNGVFAEYPKSRAIALAKQLKSLGNPVTASLVEHPDGEVLTFGG